jgi:mono/diheme cytochrome c family protein
MQRNAVIVPCFAAAWMLALSSGAFAQDGGAALNDSQKLGQRLFYQSCVVCHTKPQITSGQYAPVLSKDTLAGSDDAIREFVTNGTPRMPGFKYQFAPAQINAIVAYLKTVPAPTPPAPKAQ